MFGVPVREMGELVSLPFGDWCVLRRALFAKSAPFASLPAKPWFCFSPSVLDSLPSGPGTTTYLFLLGQLGPHRLDAIATLDDVCLERDGTGAAVQLEEEAAGVAEDGARLVAAPERRGRRLAVLAGGLCGFAIMVSHGRHAGGGARCDNATPVEWTTGKVGEIED